ncbi:CGNR zinc finger domain-containing protein [Kitasatospora sp. NPDC001159]
MGTEACAEGRSDGPRQAEEAEGAAGPASPRASATALGSRFASRLGLCSAPVCDRVHVDVSRNGTRRFFSTACQNRVRTAAHRARTQGA